MMKKLLILALSMTLLTACMKSAGEDAIPLRVWVGDNADVAWMEQVIRDFEAAHPDRKYDIQIGVQNEGDASKVILADVGSAADVFTFADDQMPSLLQAGALMPLQQHAEMIRTSHLSGAVDAATGTDGQIYAYPATADNGYFLFYNAKHIARQDAESFESLLDRAAGLGKRVAFPLSNAWYLYSFFKGAGLDVTLAPDGVSNVCTWNATDTPITGVQVMESVMKLAQHPGFVDADSDAFVAGLKDGSIIAGVSGTWNAAVARQIWGVDYAAAKLPTYQADGQEVQMHSFAGYKLVGVNAYSAHVGDAMDLAAFMTSEEAQTDRFRMRRQGPSHLKALNDPEVRREPAILALEEQSPYAHVQRVGAKYWDAAAALGKIIGTGKTDGAELQTLLDNAVRGITAPADQ